MTPEEMSCKGDIYRPLITNVRRSYMIKLQIILLPDENV